MATKSSCDPATAIPASGEEEAQQQTFSQSRRGGKSEVVPVAGDKAGGELLDFPERVALLEIAIANHPVTARQEITEEVASSSIAKKLGNDNTEDTHCRHEG